MGHFHNMPAHFLSFLILPFLYTYEHQNVRWYFMQITFIILLIVTPFINFLLFVINEAAYLDSYTKLKWFSNG